MILSILKMKCPKCHQGDIFTNKNPYKLSTLSQINKNCSCCGQDLEPEPGFYFGAMYVSYGLGTAYFLLSFFIFDYLLDFPAWLFLGTYITSMLVLWPVVFRISRVIYINLFVHYDKNACNVHHRKNR